MCRIAKPLAAILLLLSSSGRTTTTTTTTSALSFPSLLPENPKQQPRRSFLAITIAAGASVSSPSLGFLSSNNANANAANLPSIYEGMSAFASNKVEESVAIYDSIIQDDPRRKPFLWQRGLSLYYAERYQDGAEQFKTDVAVNPNDTEEQIWHLLCLAKMEGVGSLDAAREQKLTVGKDRRPVMRLVQKLFLGESGSEQELVAIAEKSNVGDKFYASLYLSLYYESLNDEKSSKQWMVNAVGSEYAKTVGRKDPMVDVAKVAMQRRGW
jgi:tetratricopeptide (TPR) repeat protein